MWGGGGQGAWAGESSLPVRSSPISVTKAGARVYPPGARVYLGTSGKPLQGPCCHSGAALMLIGGARHLQRSYKCHQVRRSMDVAATQVAAFSRLSEVRSGSIWGWFGALWAPNRPQTIPTGTRTTSNCSHISCSHIHRSPTIAPAPVRDSSLSHFDLRPFLGGCASHGRRGS